jgi:hypothetical protein
MYEHAQSAFEEMIAAGIAPDTIAYGALLIILNKDSRSEDALQIGKSLRSQGIPFDDVAYTEMLIACSRYRSDRLNCW